VSSPDDKAKRREFKQRLESLITLASFNMTNLIDNVILDSTWGQPFGTAWNEPRDLVTLKSYIKQHGASLEDSKFIELFMGGVQGAFDVYASKVVYNNDGFGYKSFWHIDNAEERAKAEQAFKVDQLRKREELVASIDDKSFRKSLTNMLLTSAGIKTGSVKKPWGQFMPTLPCNYITD